MTITKHLESISFSNLTLPDLLELPKSNRWKRQLQYPFRRTTPSTTSSFISSIDILQTTYIHPVVLLAIKVFSFSIIYHLVEEKTSKSIQGFNYSWYITFFELSCAFLLEFIERISIVFNSLNPETSNLAIIDEESQSLISSNSHSSESIYLTKSICHRLYISICSLFSCDIFCWSYIFLSFNLIFSRGLATIVLQYYDMDYPTYAICRNSKMVFVMFLSVVWLKKSYHCTDWILVVLTSLSVLCFRLASHDESWFSSANTMGVPLLLLSTFLSAMDNSWKEKVTIGICGISPNEILFNINLIAISILFIYLTIFSMEYIEATLFLIYNPSALIWMLLRGISYSLWIHFSVVLIAKAGALINQYVSASRKLFSVILSFLIFGRPFYFMHSIGFIFFAAACFIKIIVAKNKYSINNKNNNNHNNNNKKIKISPISNDDFDNINIMHYQQISTKTSDTDSDVEKKENNNDNNNIDDELRSFPIPQNMDNIQFKNRKENNYIIKQIMDNTSFVNSISSQTSNILKEGDVDKEKKDDDEEEESLNDSDLSSLEEKKHNGYNLKNNKNIYTTNRMMIFVQ